MTRVKELESMLHKTSKNSHNHFDARLKTHKLTGGLKDLWHLVYLTIAG